MDLYEFAWYMFICVLDVFMSSVRAMRVHAALCRPQTKDAPGIWEHVLHGFQQL